MNEPVASGFHSDTRESPEHISQALRQLVSVKARFLRCQREIKFLGAPESGSKLGLIDELTAPFQASEQVRTYLLVALDNLRVLLRYFSKTNELPMIAFYSLIRPAIESTSYGMWLLWGNGNDKKASRSLRISRQNFNSFKSLGTEFSLSSSSTSTDVQIKTLHSNLRGVESRALENAIQATSIISAVDGYLSPRTSFFTGLQVWRSTSGIAHANAPVMAVLLERHPDGPNPGDSATRTSRLTFVVGFIETALENMEALLDLYAKSCAAPHRKSATKIPS